MNKDERVAIRMTEPEREALRRAALMELRNESEMARELMREGLQRRGVWPVSTAGAGNMVPLEEIRP